MQTYFQVLLNHQVKKKNQKRKKIKTYYANAKLHMQTYFQHFKISTMRGGACSKFCKHEIYIFCICEVIVT